MSSQRMRVPRESFVHRALMRAALPVVLAVGLLVPAAQPVLGVERFTSGESRFISTVIWGNWVYYSARWDVTPVQEDGRAWWRFTKFEMKVNVSRYDQCANCTGRWINTATIEFLNSAGNVTWTKSLPSNMCWGPYAVHPDDLFLVRCSAPAFQIGQVNAAKIRLKWGIAIEYGNGFWAGANQTKTVLPY